MAPSAMTTVLPELANADRAELILDTGRTYDGHEPIRIHVKKRERRLEVTDGGGAVAAAGVAPRTLSFPDHIDLGDRSVNVSRKGVVFLAGWTAGSEEWLRALQELVAEGSLALYEALLDAV
jgi:hypothetical protein